MSAGEGSVWPSGTGSADAPSPRRPATVDGQRRAGRVGGHPAGEKHRRSGYLSRVGEPLQRRPVLDGRPEVLVGPEVGRQVGCDVSGRQAVHPHVGRPVQREAPGQTHQSVLRGDVGVLTGQSHEAADGGDVDQDSLGGSQRRLGRPGAGEGPLEVDVDHLLESLVRHRSGDPERGVGVDAALGPPGAVSDEGFQQVVDVNLQGAFACARAAESALTASKGVLVNVASVGGLVGLPRQHPYVASKHGLVGLTRSLALDWAPDVRVNCLAPGYVATDLTEEVRADEDLRTSIEDRTPLERFADPGEIAGPAVFLASAMASYATGATLTVDGGWTAR